MLTAVPVKTADASGEEPVTITWWTEPILGSNREAFEALIIEPFNAAHPGMMLKVNFVADLERVTRTAIQGGKGPDIIQSPGPAFVMDLVDAGHVLPIDAYAEQYGWRKVIYPWAMEIGRVNGSLYSLPLTYETMVLFYNATLFEKMGWEPPTNRTELELLAQAAADAGIIPFAHSNASWKAANEWFVTVFYNNYAGSQAVYEALSGQRSWDDPLFVEATELLKTYMDRNWFAGGRENYYTLQHSDVWGALGDGTAAMQMVGTWGFLHAKTYFDGTGNEWAWAPLPPLRDGIEVDYPLGIGSSISINAASAYPEAAAAVMDWLYSDPKRIAKLISAIGGGEYVVPVRLTAADFPPEADLRLIEALSTFAAAFEAGRYGYTTWSFWPPATAQLIISGMEQVWNGDITPAEYCAQQQRSFAEELSAGRVVPLPER
ncbi:MAG: carbohydrate ABC transporter substrate-binding protein [Anaerolineae bacterium]|nr:carbohydrate ABC transporter substrate-binding protein [Anaerolineae bacterium]